MVLPNDWMHLRLSNDFGIGVPSWEKIICSLLLHGEQNFDSSACPIDMLHLLYFSLPAYCREAAVNAFFVCTTVCCCYIVAKSTWLSPRQNVTQLRKKQTCHQSCHVPQQTGWGHCKWSLRGQKQKHQSWSSRASQHLGQQRSPLWKTAHRSFGEPGQKNSTLYSEKAAHKFKVGSTQNNHWNNAHAI